MKLDKAQEKALRALREVLDRRDGIYRDLADASDLKTYLAVGAPRDDEELLTEQVLADILERVLEFPPDAYFPQLSKSGLKPDFTPMDLIAHPYVLDAKSSKQRLADHEAQIREGLVGGGFPRVSLPQAARGLHRRSTGQAGSACGAIG